MKIYILEDEVYCMRHHGGGPSPRTAILDLCKGHDLTVAVSIEEGWEKFKWDAHYDLWLLDHDMEGHYEFTPDYPNTGFKFLEKLLNDGWRKGVPFPKVVLHSWNTDGRKRQRNVMEKHGIPPGFIYDTHFMPETYGKFVKEKIGL